jgi:hypothetical protein
MVNEIDKFIPSLAFSAEFPQKGRRTESPIPNLKAESGKDSERKTPIPKIDPQSEQQN